MSHNLRAPVANILGITDFLKNAKVKKEKDIEFAVNGVEKSAKSLDQIIVDLNEIIQVKQHHNIEKVIIDLNELMDEILSLMSNSNLDNSFSVNANFNAISKLSSVKSYLHSIFYNLISNSLKYCREHVKARLDIWTEQVDGQIVLNFKDNGIGIDLPLYEKQLFGLYNRFNSKAEGKGFGLFMVKSQVEALNGSIEVRSCVNIGTHFLIKFPLN